jgi:hypothetical protein
MLLRTETAFFFTTSVVAAELAFCQEAMMTKLAIHSSGLLDC